MISILPYEHLDQFQPERFRVGPSHEYLLPFRDRSYRLLPSGRHAMTAVLASLGLNRTDEVLLTNTSGQTYISACVTCTIFNFCQPSRELTADTRAIFVIHENGLPHPELDRLHEEGAKRGIPVIEDCAHTYDSTHDGKNVGTIGDFGIFSLPKIFPMATGGILVGKELPQFELKAWENESISFIEASFHRYGPYLAWLSQRRKDNYQALRNYFTGCTLFFECGMEVTPIFFGVFLERAWKIRQKSRQVQWGSTLKDDLLLIPTNPLVDAQALVEAVDQAVMPYV